METVEHNADYTEWTLRIREGITFHDGTPLNGAAVKFNIDANRASPLTAGALTPIDTVAPLGPGRGDHDQGRALGGAAELPDLRLDRVRAVADMAGEPARHPAAHRGWPGVRRHGRGHAGRRRCDEAGRSRRVRFESYTPGNGNTFRAVRNEDYWRGPNGITGEDLPYLDAIEAVASVDIDSRQNALRSGQFDAMHTANSDAISQLLERRQPRGVVVEPLRRHVVLRHQRRGRSGARPGGREHGEPTAQRPLPARPRPRHGPPAHGGRAWRRPRAARQRPVPTRLDRLPRGQRVPVSSMSTWRTPEMDQCLSELGTDSIDFRFDTTNDPFNVETGALVQSMWGEAFGDRVRSTITPIEQGQYIGLALVGDYNVLQGRGYGGLDPDQQRLWWQKASANPVGELALNSARIYDDVIDEALQTIKSNPDPDVRRGGRRDDQPPGSASRCTSGGGAGRCGASPPSRMSTVSSTTCSPTAHPASGWRSPAVTRSTRSGATTAAASDVRLSCGDGEPVAAAQRQTSMSGRRALVVASSSWAPSPPVVRTDQRSDRPRRRPGRSSRPPRPRRCRRRSCTRWRSTRRWTWRTATTRRSKEMAQAADLVVVGVVEGVDSLGRPAIAGGPVGR